MAEAHMLLPSPVIMSQELRFTWRSGVELERKGIFPLHRAAIGARIVVPGLDFSSRSSSNCCISIRSVLSRKCRRWVEAGVSQSRVSQFIPSKDKRLIENERSDIIPTTAVEDLNSARDPGPLNGRISVSGNEGDGDRIGTLQRESRMGVFDILARDAEVIREGVTRVQDILLPDAGASMRQRLGAVENGGPMVKNGTRRDETVQEPAGTLHVRAIVVLETIARDGRIMKESLSSVVKDFQKFPLTQEEVRARFSMPKLYRDKEVNMGSKFQSGKISIVRKMKEGVTYLTEVKNVLVQPSEPVLKWAEIVGKRTRVDKIIQKDFEFIREGMNSVQEELKEVIRVRRWENNFIARETAAPWPEPAYSGKDLLAADTEAIKSYGNYFRGLLNTWRIPLQRSYDPEALANYFNLRPHLLLFRFFEVSAAVSGVAFQLFMDKVGVQRGWIGESEASQLTLKTAEALKQTLLRLGPTFIKVAQSLSSRPDLIGIETAKVLSELQDRLPPFPTEEAMALIELELGVPASKVFSFLSTNPVAAASFGQVYRGRTMDGEEVAVKVQRPDLLFDVALDVYVLRLGLGIIRKLAKINSDISVLADELGYGLFGELDYTLEAANAIEFGESVKHLSYVKVPRTLPHLTRKRVLTMEWITGYRPLDLQLIAEGNDPNVDLAGIDRQQAKLFLDDLVRKGVECSLVQLLETGVMHADPHPGNLLYTKDAILVYLDFGLLARVTKKHRAAMLAVIAHLVNAEWQCLANDFGDLDILKPSTDRFALRLALERAFGQGPDAVVKNGVPDIQFGQVTGKLWKIALEFRFRLPAYYTLVLRALASLEGVAVSVDPDYKVFAAAYPYVVRRLLSDNSHTSRQVLQSLVLTQKKEFRWGRIADIMATSREGAHHSVVQRTGQSLAADLPGLQVTKVPDGRALASVLLSFSLSREGTSVRRVLLEADTKSLVEAFISPSARFLRRKVSFALANTFYLSILTFTHVGTKWASMSTGPGRNMGSLSSTGGLSKRDGSQSEIEPVLNAENRNVSESRMNNHRLWFLLKVLASRLRSSPILMVRVSCALFTIVAVAAALALHKYFITLSDRLLSAKTNRILGIPPSPALQGESVHNTVV